MLIWCNIFACYQWIIVLYRGDCYAYLWQFKLLTFLHINPLHPNIIMHILHTVSYVADKGNMFNNQKHISW